MTIFFSQFYQSSQIEQATQPKQQEDENGLYESMMTLMPRLILIQIH